MSARNNGKYPKPTYPPPPRADLDLQISLLTEHELTKVATLLDDMAKQLGVKTKVEGELKEVEEDVAPDSVLDQIEKKMQ
jgi:uncharacterized membrane protein